MALGHEEVCEGSNPPATLVYECVSWMEALDAFLWTGFTRTFVKQTAFENKSILPLWDKKSVCLFFIIEINVHNQSIGNQIYPALETVVP